MNIETIAAQKAALRKQLTAQRSHIDRQTKEDADRKIYQNLIATEAFQACPILLTYVSMSDEVDSLQIIQHALRAGKTVAVPCCVAGKREMEFYEIASLDELITGSYGILEPRPNPEKRIKSNPYSLCLLPGLAFDKWGGRLGYGGGYYDRFLAGFGGVTAGLCRSFSLFADRLPMDSHDIAARMIVTETEVIATGTDIK